MDRQSVRKQERESVRRGERGSGGAGSEKRFEQEVTESRHPKNYPLGTGTLLRNSHDCQKRMHPGDEEMRGVQPLGQHL